MKTISKAEFLQLEGLLALAHQYVRKVNAIAEAAAEVVGEKVDWSDLDQRGDSAAWDFCFAEPPIGEPATAGSLCRKLNIAVIEWGKGNFTEGREGRKGTDQPRNTVRANTRKGRKR